MIRLATPSARGQPVVWRDPTIAPVIVCVVLMHAIIVARKWRPPRPLRGEPADGCSW